MRMSALTLALALSAAAVAGCGGPEQDSNRAAGNAETLPDEPLLNDTTGAPIRDSAERPGEPAPPPAPKPAPKPDPEPKVIVDPPPPPPDPHAGHDMDNMSNGS